jgi:hypothetical protein
MGASSVVQQGLRTPKGPVFASFCIVGIRGLGLQVCVHEAVDKTDGAVFRCTLSGSEADRWLEVPAWMFDRTACADGVILCTSPFITVAALSALAGLLANVLRARPASSNAPLSGASGISRDQNRGEGHVRENSVSQDAGAADRDNTRLAAQAGADGSCRKRPTQRCDRRADMAGTSGGNTTRADKSDVTADPGACRQELAQHRDGGRPPGKQRAAICHAEPPDGAGLVRNRGHR